MHCCMLLSHAVFAVQQILKEAERQVLWAAAQLVWYMPIPAWHMLAHDSEAPKCLALQVILTHGLISLLEV